MEGTTQRIPVDTQSCCGPALIRPLILQDRQNECFLELTYCFRVLDPDPIHLPCEIFELDLHKGCSYAPPRIFKPDHRPRQPDSCSFVLSSAACGAFTNHTEQLGTHVSAIPKYISCKRSLKVTLEARFDVDPLGNPRGRGLPCIVASSGDGKAGSYLAHENAT